MPRNVMFKPWRVIIRWINEKGNWTRKNYYYDDPKEMVNFVVKDMIVFQKDYQDGIRRTTMTAQTTISERQDWNGASDQDHLRALEERKR